MGQVMVLPFKDERASESRFGASFYTHAAYRVDRNQDNWNWCNGEADNVGYYDKQCFDKNLDSLSDTDGWLPFPGKIIVK